MFSAKYENKLEKKNKVEAQKTCQEGFDISSEI